MDRTHSVSTGGFLVLSSRAINTTYPLAGGANLSADQTHSVDTAFLVNTGRQILSVFPLSGGANFSTDRTLSVSTGGFLVLSSRTINTAYPLAGGANLAADLTVTVDTAFLVNTARQILSGSGLSGGGNLSADRTISLVTPVVVTSGGTGAATFTAFGLLYGSGGQPIQVMAAINSGQLIVGSGINMPPRLFGPGSDGQMLLAQSGALGGFIFVNTSAAGGGTTVYAPTGGTYVMMSGSSPPFTNARILSGSSGLTFTDAGAANSAYFSVNTNVRDKEFVFYAVGALSVSMLIDKARIRIPFNMDLVRVDLALTSTPLVSGITCQALQYPFPNSAGNVVWTTSSSMPQILAGQAAGSTTTFDTVTLFANSYLGISILQVGSVSAQGSNMTVTFVARTS